MLAPLFQPGPAPSRLALRRIHSWYAPTSVAPPRRFVQDSDVEALRARPGPVPQAWALPESFQQLRRFAQDPDAPFARPALGQVVASWEPMPSPAFPRRYVPEEEEPEALVLRAPFRLILEAWDVAIPAQQRRFAQEEELEEQPVMRPAFRYIIEAAWQLSIEAPRRAFGYPPIIEVPPPEVPAPPAHECFPPVPPPVTGFSRLGPLAPAFSRGSLGTSYSRAAQALGVGYGDNYGEDYGSSAAAASETVFSRAAPQQFPRFTPEDALLTITRVSGYGEDYSFDYGGQGATEVFTRERALLGQFGRDSLAGLAFTRAASAGLVSTRESLLGVAGSGYGDDYGSGYGGSTAPPLFTRDPALSPDDTRESVPDCVGNLGYGDDYGFNYGGG